MGTQVLFEVYKNRGEETMGDFRGNWNDGMYYVSRYIEEYTVSVV